MLACGVLRARAECQLCQVGGPTKFVPPRYFFSQPCCLYVEGSFDDGCDEAKVRALARVLDQCSTLLGTTAPKSGSSMTFFRCVHNVVFAAEFRLTLSERSNRKDKSLLGGLEGSQPCEQHATILLILVFFVRRSRVLRFRILF